MESDPAPIIEWDLSDLFASLDDPEIAAAINRNRNAAECFQIAYKGQVAGLNPQQLVAAIQEYESILAIVFKLSQYSMLRLAKETNADAIKKFELQIREENTFVQNQVVFFELELGHLPASWLSTIEQSLPVNGYAYFVEARMKTAAYQLSEAEEKIINLKKITGIQAFQNLYEEITAGFQFDFELDGQVRRLSGEELRSLRQHADPLVRQQAMELFLNRYKENRVVISHTFNQIIKDYNIERKLRGYSSPIGVRNIENDIDDRVVNVLHEVTTSSYPLVQKYYKIKSELMKMPGMSLHDIYAPLAYNRKTYNWPEAKTIVMDAFAGFDREFLSIAEMLFNKRHVDAVILPGKRGGAFCSSSVPEKNPYVMLNYLGKWRDVSTVAHEFGHAIHAVYSQGQRLLNYHASLPLAETASIFSEMILTDYMMKHESDAAIRQAMLSAKLEEIIATSHRQNMFSLFEHSAHAMIDEGLAGSEALCHLYRQELARMFGQTVAIPELYEWEWAAIPHLFEMPFYVYAYNFANLLVIGLYCQFQDEGRAFIPKFKKILSLGSVMSPVKMLESMGVNLAETKFWEQSLAQIQKMVDELEHMQQQQTLA